MWVSYATNSKRGKKKITRTHKGEEESDNDCVQRTKGSPKTPHGLLQNHTKIPTIKPNQNSGLNNILSKSRKSKQLDFVPTPISNWANSNHTSNSQTHTHKQCFLHQKIINIKSQNNRVNIKKTKFHLINKINKHRTIQRRQYQKNDPDLLRIKTPITITIVIYIYQTYSWKWIQIWLGTEMIRFGTYLWIYRVCSMDLGETREAEAESR